MAENVASFPKNNDNENKNEDSSQSRLKSLIARIERLEEEKSALMEDIKEVYGEAKATGFEPKIMRRVIKLRKMDDQKRREEDELLDLYLSVVGSVAA